MNIAHDLKAGELMASWVVQVGDQDQVIHVWKYTRGYAGVDTARNNLAKNSVRRKMDRKC